VLAAEPDSRYAPQPDSQFFTKAKFYTAADHQNNASILSTDDNQHAMQLESPTYEGMGMSAQHQRGYDSIISSGGPAAVPFANNPLSGSSTTRNDK